MAQSSAEARPGEAASEARTARVSRFEWERLVLMSDFPEADRFRLLALAVFMDGPSGGGARPGNGGLSLFGPHEETWKKLLRRAVAAGWLVLTERGGARRGPGGVTIRRASVYAASVPVEVYARREEILSAPPFKKEAPTAYLKEAGPASKEAPQPLEGSEEGFEGSPQGLHHQASTSNIPSPRVGAGRRRQASDGSMKEVQSLGEAVAELLADHAKQPVTSSWGEKVCRQVLGGRDVRNPLAYITEAIGKAPYLYLPQNAPWDKPVPSAGQANPDGYERGATLARKLLAARSEKQTEEAETPPDQGRNVSESEKKRAGRARPSKLVSGLKGQG